MTLSPDGFWGAAAFVNLLSTSDPATGSFQKVNTGGGLGLRIKLNKRSTTNITVDTGRPGRGQRTLPGRRAF